MVGARHAHVGQPPIATGSIRRRLLVALLALSGLWSVSPLLAWVYGLGSFGAWFWLGVTPAFVLLAAATVVLRRREPRSELLTAISSGVLGGVLATVVYDLVRVPVVAWTGYRLFAPVASYGLLITGARSSSQLTELVGWTYNLTNGVGFGIAFALLGFRRGWAWAIPFALALETITVVTPYADVYGLRGHWDVIAIAYGAHVAYGATLGLTLRAVARDRDPVAGSQALWAMGATAVVLVILLHPWRAPTSVSVRSASGLPAAAVVGGQFQPEWVRIPVGGCIVLDNHDHVPHRLGALTGASLLPADGQARYCFTAAGTRRVQLDNRPYSGGWVLVDPALRD